MASISSLLSQTSSYDNFVTQLVQIESQKKFKLQVQQLERNEEKSALGAVSSAISEFENKIKELEEPTNKSFEPFKFSSSDEDVVEVTSASGIDRTSSYNITVARLATADTALSQVMTADGYDLATTGPGSIDITIGGKTETINIQTTKDDGGGGTVDMTNKEILTALSDEISSLFEEEARASVFQINDTEVQFSIQSLQTGFDNRVQLSNATGALADVEAGITHLKPEAELDAQFTVDGVTFTRSGNEIDDAIEGLSFTLKKDTGVQETMTVERNVDEAIDNIDSFINAFNKVNTTINNRTFINPDTGNKGPLQGMRSIRNLALNIRQTSLLEFGGAADGEVSRLSDLGISLNNSGSLEIEDRDLLEEVLSQRPEEVSAFFSDENSPIAMIKGRLEAYTESGGILSALEDGVDQKLERLDRRIEREEKYLEEYEAEQRRIFNELDLMLERGQAQFDQVSNFMSGY